MEDKYKNKLEVILSKCTKNVKNGCLLYEGRHTPAQCYPKVKIVHNRRPYVMNVHASVHKVSNNIAPYTSLGPNMDVSHLCHHPLCMNPTHLNLENRLTNNIRKTCYRNRQCVGHDSHPDCMF